MRSILFVCTANLCRSPMAEGVFRRLVGRHGREREFEIDSAGTLAAHAGKRPFHLAQGAARKRGYDIGRCVARTIHPDDFDRFDHILVMDRSNLKALRGIAPTRCKHKIELLLEYGDKYHGQDVPDPYGGEAEAFELALDMIEDGCGGLVQLMLRAA